MGFGEEPVIGQASVVLMTLGVAGLSRQLYYHLRNKGGHGIKAASANFEQQCQSLFDNRIALMDAENLDEAFLGRMTELKRLAIDYFELSGRIKENEDKIAAQENMMRISAMRFATEGTSDVSGTIEALMESLGVAKEKAIFNKNYDIEISAYEKDLEELKAEKNAREELYRTLGSGNMELGFEALSRYIQRKEELRRLKDELERDESYLFSKVAIGALSDEEKTIIINTDAMELNTEIEELEKRAQVMDERLLGLKNQQRKILTGKTVEIINSEIHSINSSIEGYKEKWNQLRIMKEMIVVSEKSFKEKNQPELFKKAQEYLAIMTDGKYDRIAIKEVDGRKNVVLGEEISYNLSKGTMQQLYFALRLSLIDLLEKDNCKLPLFLDELLVNWDSSRLQSTIELLNEISKSRQIFIFTCQEALIKDFAEHKTVNIINLG